MQVGLKYKSKLFKINAEKVDAFGRFRGLMFRKKEHCPALLFEFNKKVHYSIHSYFVNFPFLAVWLDDKNEILEISVISPWKISIKPKKSYKKLLEVPINERYHWIVGVLVGIQKHL